MTEPFRICIDEEALPVKVRRNAQAKRMILRVCPQTGEIKLTLPVHTGERSAIRFIEEHVGWIAEERRKAMTIERLGDGDVIPFKGEPCRLAFENTGRRLVTHSPGLISVGGPAEHASARLLNWLKAQAKAELSDRCRQSALTLGVQYSRISIGDMKSRWGSCSARGTLRFNWRLVMAPAPVLNYVAVHEVSHLREMNHSDRFWAHVAHCDPGYQQHRRWLKQQGSALFAIQL